MTSWLVAPKCNGCTMFCRNSATQLADKFRDDNTICCNRRFQGGDIRGERLACFCDRLSRRMIDDLLGSFRLRQCGFERQHRSNIILDREPPGGLFVADQSRQIRVVERRYAHRLHIEKDGFLVTLQMNIKEIARSITLRDQGGDTVLVFDPHQNGVLVIGRFLIVEIDPRLQPDIDAASNDPDADMGRHQTPILVRNLSQA